MLPLNTNLPLQQHYNISLKKLIFTAFYYIITTSIIFFTFILTKLRK